MSRILVFGSANIDLVVPVKKLPAPGETVLGGDLMTAFGGKGANQAVAAARLGGHVDFVGKLGNDAFGERYLEHLRTEGVGVSRVTREAKRPTGCAMILVEEKGQNQIVVAPGSNHALTPGDVEAASALVEQSDIVLVQLEIPLETVTAVVRRANAAGTPVLLNPSPVNPAFRLKDLRIDYLVLNEVEAEQLTGRACRGPSGLEDWMTALLAQGARRIILTRGREDTVVAKGVSVDCVATFPVEAVDTVGAGDTFAGALAVASAERMPLVKAVRFANAAAALATTKLGAQTSMPSRKEVEAFLRGNASSPGL